MDRDDHNRGARHMVYRMEVGHRSEDVSAITNLRSAVKPTHRSIGYWTFMMSTPPWTCFQTRCVGDGISVGTRVVNPTLVTGLLALVASFILGVARLPAKILAIQRSLARMLGVVYACDRSRLDLVGVQVELLAFPHLPLHFLEQ